MEEERRLCYVGMTRARKNVHISFAANRRTFADWQANIPSRFIEELPPEHIEVRSESGLYGAGGLGFADTKSPAFEARPWDSPGRRRLRQHRALNRDGQIIDGRAEALDWDAEPDGAFAQGDRIFHQKFGYGRIEAIDGNRLEIAFDKAGTKKVIDSFVRPA